MQQITNHAQTRLQQRGIPEIIVDSLLEYGREIHDHRGATILYFDKHVRQLLRDSLSHQSLRNLESHLDTYAVLDRDGAVITVGHRTKRINRY
jgi:hypothetical protein